MIKKQVLLILSMLVLFFIDGQLSFFLSGLTGFKWLITSQLLLICLFYTALVQRQIWLYLFLAMLGLFYDQHYLMMIGFSTYLFPLLGLLIMLTRRIWLKGFWDRAIGLFGVMLAFPVLIYLLACYHQITTESFSHFVQHELIGTLLLNTLFIFFILRYIEPRVFSRSEFRQISTEL